MNTNGTTQVQAKEIMGEHFFGVSKIQSLLRYYAEVEDSKGRRSELKDYTLSEKKTAPLERIPFSTERLHECKETHALMAFFPSVQDKLFRQFVVNKLDDAIGLPTAEARWLLFPLYGIEGRSTLPAEETLYAHTVGYFRGLLSSCTPLITTSKDAQGSPLCLCSGTTSGMFASVGWVTMLAARRIIRVTSPCYLQVLCGDRGEGLFIPSSAFPRLHPTEKMELTCRSSHHRLSYWVEVRECRQEPWLKGGSSTR